MIIGDPQGEVLGQITLYSRSYCNCFFTYSASKMVSLYSIIFNDEEYSSSCIPTTSKTDLCSHFLLWSIPLGAWKTSLDIYKILFYWCLCSSIHPYKDSFTLINSPSCWLCIKKRNTNFLLELINFFAWFALSNEILDLPLCALMMKYLPSFIK